MVTNGGQTFYGTTRATPRHWSEWKDPGPREEGEIGSRLERDVWTLLAPDRLLDVVAHFIVFRRRGDEVAKGICRYQQCWAVNRIVRWVVEGEHRRGLVWPK